MGSFLKSLPGRYGIKVNEVRKEVEDRGYALRPLRPLS
jgi:hypothetical protein